MNTFSQSLFGKLEQESISDCNGFHFCKKKKVSNNERFRSDALLRNLGRRKKEFNKSMMIQGQPNHNCDCMLCNLSTDSSQISRSAALYTMHPHPIHHLPIVCRNELTQKTCPQKRAAMPHFRRKCRNYEITG